MHLASRKPSETAPDRLGALAKLPVFLDLQGKRAIVAGGTAAAAWKAELLAAAGADVEVYAQTTEPEMQALLARGAAAGSLTHRARAWSMDVLEGAALALADAADDAEAEAFARAARAAGTPVNIIDRPAYCQFQFGSIVNRSPVVVGIATDGAAPILAQAIRRRIETLLPPSLADWGALAKRIRRAVLERLPKGRARRAFWEAFAERAMAGSRPPSDDDALVGVVRASDPNADGPAGHVTLVGAGPGDAELLTLKAVRALQGADVILFDDLVPPEVLELARREAKRMLVGKRGGCASVAQSEIDGLMIKLAQQGRHVVRLKSGDPMIFGRGGEEIARLEAAGIAVSVVPGITTGLALAAALGASLTHRDHAHSVRFVTAHAHKGGLPDDLDWRGLADPATTLILYMGGRTGPAMAARLIERGLPAETPAVMCAGLMRADERRWFGTLTELAGGQGLDLRGQPTVIGIGKVFAQRQAEATRTTHDLAAAARSV